MARKNIIRIYRFLLFCALVIFPCGYLQASPGEPQGPIEIEVYPDISVNKDFSGFGAETLPWLWTRENKEGGVNSEDIKLNLERIRQMQLPITRIFAPWETWNPSVDYKTFTWESDEMKSLCKILDVYQETGTKVILVTVDWLKDSPWRNAYDSAQAVLRLLEYLIRERGYNCIQYWTLTNEPELTYGWLKKMSFENYVQIHQLVKKGLKARKLPVKIIVSDDVQSREWFSRSLQSLYKVADVYSSHLYLFPQQMETLPRFFAERLTEIKKVSHKSIPFFLCEFGFKGSKFSSSVNSLMNEYEYGLYVATLCIEALNSGVDCASLWCLHQIRLIDKVRPESGEIMRIGLWGYKDKKWGPFPAFYLYSLFTRYIKPDSKILKVKASSPQMLKAACAEYAGRHSLFIINFTDKEQNISIRGLVSNKDFKKHLYTKSAFSSQAKKSPGTEDKIMISDYFKDRIPPQSVVVYTNLEND